MSWRTWTNWWSNPTFHQGMAGPGVDKARLSMAKVDAKADLNFLVPLAGVIPPKQGTLSKKIDSWTLQLWRKRWNDIQTCRQTKFWFSSGPRFNIAKELLKLERTELGILIQFFTGHGWLRRHCGIIDGITDKTCQLCHQGEEDPEHLWSCCSATELVRRQCTQDNQDNTWQLKEVNRFLGTNLMVELLKRTQEEQVCEV